MTDTLAPLVDRQTAAGHLVVRVVGSMGQPWVTAWLDGTVISEAAGIGYLRTPSVRDGRTISHYITSRSGQSYAVYAEEAAAIERGMVTMREQIAASPAGMREHRRGLLHDAAIARELDAEERNRAWEREDESGAFVGDRRGAIAAADQALAVFDAAHPEIAAQWDATAEAVREAELQQQINYRGE